MPRRIKIFDTTLRDGEQSPGASMSLEQKIKMASALERLGVDRIEAGFPVSSPVQFEAVQRVSATVKKAEVVGLARCVQRDIDAAYDALRDAAHPMLHIFIATSPLHREYKLKKSKEEILDTVRECLNYGGKGFSRMEFSPEDASRTEPDYLVEVVKTAIECGATSINIPDTVGYAVPKEFGQLISFLVEQVPQFSDGSVDLSVHCHNDLGLALANSLAAVRSGASQVEVTLNGIGERAGNCPMEELIMSLDVRKDMFDVETGIHTEYLYPTGKLLQSITGLLIPRNKPIFGDNVFVHESGIHQHGVLNKRETYEIMKPERIGRSSETIIMGRHSGKHALEDKLSQYNIKLTRQQFEDVFARFTAIADKKKEVYDEDLFSIVGTVLGGVVKGFSLLYFHTFTGNSLIPGATVKVRSEAGEKVASATGDGPVDAVFNAIDECVGINARLKEYIIHAIGSGKDAQGEVKLEVEIEGATYGGKASSTDIIEASAMAYLNAVNRFELRKR
ncbi:2-isopropylmalate synthase [Sediminispirochaeta smaragdinae]|uniref:2-isopropylmalate synthase n=1 Tax=Sediminispirochaeta smaragdinae (strain DSM 11293 / JCM 15392 / SEBR 4228) TaxID=573413 RepID=LEU1_SEDSS|nr:2-isopropylmalate synthase [Sediminispirochaeta smaragdinae]E1R5X1.1 RecName: Full=2-isopropylmalate synthase; AltName: Full=Alpha-IPM synthase; AltName: Full=Alpha-isopropylmalate synthase [Sediminispirochaeta smaragdinae DSM 11293]ADK80736.1 2-isopropylmalate synthase [Sediminispirochaeta smaragdinae DSM 11293]